MLYFSFIFPCTKKTYTLVKQTSGKIGKNIQKNVYSGHAFSLLDVVRINKPFCEVYQWRIIMQSNPLVKEDLSQRTEMYHFHTGTSQSILHNWAHNVHFAHLAKTNFKFFLKSKNLK